MIVRPYQPDDEAAVVALWARCDLTRPWNDPHKDIRRKLRVRPDLFLVGVLGQEIVATAMVGYDGHRGWINYLGVAPEHRRKASPAASWKRRGGCYGSAAAQKSTSRCAPRTRPRLGFTGALGTASMM
jgi:hypothetical protein